MSKNCVTYDSYIKLDDETDTAEVSRKLAETFSVNDTSTLQDTLQKLGVEVKTDARKLLCGVTLTDKCEISPENIFEALAPYAAKGSWAAYKDTEKSCDVVWIKDANGPVSHTYDLGAFDTKKMEDNVHDLVWGLGQTLMVIEKVLEEEVDETRVVSTIINTLYTNTQPSVM